ncbi:Protein fluG [Lachnellula suecica]|uniref:Protein fluG n=1 Tax=Lachnellula suecica TaxID=602035 RepID=A0A8T9C304_9HELO|nr:Protein fluG [Lachnellula suecica]
MELPLQKSAETLTTFLEANPDVEYLRYQWLDIGNIVRLIIVTKHHALSLAEKPLKVSCLAFGVLPDDSFNTTRFEPAGYDELYPDWESLRLCTYVGNGKTYASVMCFVKEQSRNFPAWERDPRSILQNALERAQKSLQLRFLVGFELEFYLADQTNRENSRPVHQFDQFYGAAALRDDRVLAVLEECVQSLLRAGIKATHFHGEIGHGMFEIPTGPLRPIEAVDTLVYSKEAIKTIALKHGFNATFFPKPVLSPSLILVGGHTHFSIDNATQMVADSFLAGVLDKLPAPCAFSMPNVDSYHRLGGHRGTVGTWVGWGTEDKDISIRKISGRIGYWEIRCADQMANMYYALAAWITAGCAGVKEQKKLRWKDPPSLIAAMTPEEVAELGWDTKLPSSLAESVDALKSSLQGHKLNDLGVEFLNMYCDFKKLEVKQFGEKTEKERLDLFSRIF